MAEVNKRKAKVATEKLTELYEQLDKAKKVVRNLQREIDDYIDELRIDEEDNNNDMGRS